MDDAALDTTDVTSQPDLFNRIYIILNHAIVERKTKVG